MEFSISHSDLISPTNIGRRLGINSSAISLKSNRSYKENHATCETDYLDYIHFPCYIQQMALVSKAHDIQPRNDGIIESMVHML